jgi:hypothetical protein
MTLRDVLNPAEAPFGVEELKQLYLFEAVRTAWERTLVAMQDPRTTSGE